MKGDFFMPKIKTRQQSEQQLINLVMAAIFCSLAYATMTATSWIKVQFLTFDAKDTVITVAGLILGPVYSVVISFIVALIEFITVSETGPYGFLMNFASSAVFSFTCALIYKYKKNIKGAITGLVAGVFSVTGFMLLFNLFITPLYMGATMADVAKMIPTLLLPFNLTKATMNAALVLIVYKPVSNVLKSARMLPQSPKKAPADDADAENIKKRENVKFSLVITAIGLVIVAVCLVVFFVVLNGSFSFGLK
jgi:riboflavin transporter FmnP